MGKIENLIKNLMFMTGLSSNFHSCVQSLKHILYCFWLLARRKIAEKQRWRNITERIGNEIRVFYGHEVIPSRYENSSGAYVKLQDLTEFHPNATSCPNVLYLVSSALPFFPIVMAREAKRKGATIIVNQNGVAYPAWHGPGWEKTNRPMKQLLQMADYVIYQSEFCKRAADIFLGSVRVPWSIMHNPVDTEVFVPRTEFPSGKRILLAGSHHQYYRVSSAIEMLKYLLQFMPEVQLTIAGRCKWRNREDECLQEARQLAAELGVTNHIQFTGPYTQADAPSLFQQHHVLVHTQYNDSCPRLVVEAMACGLPVVYSASGGVPELVGEEAGVGVSSETDWNEMHPPPPDLLANATRQVFSSLAPFSRSARNRAVEKFDRGQWLEKHRAIICRARKQ